MLITAFNNVDQASLGGTFCDMLLNGLGGACSYAANFTGPVFGTAVTVSVATVGTFAVIAAAATLARRVSDIVVNRAAEQIGFEPTAYFNWFVAAPLNLSAATSVAQTAYLVVAAVELTLGWVILPFVAHVVGIALVGVVAITALVSLFIENLPENPVADHPNEEADVDFDRANLSAFDRKVLDRIQEQIAFLNGDHTASEKMRATQDIQGQLEAYAGHMQGLQYSARLAIATNYEDGQLEEHKKAQRLFKHFQKLTAPFLLPNLT